jgi:hypothetical protein
MGPNKEVLRLAVLLACVALAASRFGLIGHELVAHGGAALAFGAEIVDVEMFWFAGGWIRYVLPEPSLAAYLTISMAGIALELIVGIGLAAVVRRRTLAGVLLRGCGLALVVHATWYLATGAFHGFGDGLLLYRELGAGRVPVAIAAGIATCIAAYLAARQTVRPLLSTLSGSSRRRIGGLAVAMVLAGGLHAGLTLGELRIRRDPTYVQTMQPEATRVVARELAEWQRLQAERGLEPSDAAKRDQLTRLQREHRSFPFVYLLAAATLLSVLAGAWRSRAREPAPIDGRLLGRAVAIALFAIWLVIMIDGAIK